jgi:hypothetical protein
MRDKAAPVQVRPCPIVPDFNQVIPSKVDAKARAISGEPFNAALNAARSEGAASIQPTAS